MSTPSSKPRSEAVQIIMDANALFAPLEFKIDLSGELERLLNRRFELVLLSAVRRELETLETEGSPKTRRMASFALKFAKKLSYVDVETSAKTVDDVIVDVAGRWKTPVFTNDAQLRRRLRDISVPVIYVRQKSHLEIEGMIQSHV